MARSLVFEQIAESAEPGAWANPSIVMRELPSPENARWMVQRTQEGLWQVAVRGYNDGVALEAEVVDANLRALVGGKPYEAIGAREPLVPVADTDIPEYVQAMTVPEAQDRVTSLYQVLEGELEGVWGLYGPAEYNDPEDYAALIFKDPSNVGLAWGTWEGGKGYHELPPVAATLEREGPLSMVLPRQPEACSVIAAHSIRDRIAPSMRGVYKRRDLTDADETALVYAQTDFEIGTVSAVRAVEPNEVLQGGLIVGNRPMGFGPDSE